MKLIAELRDLQTFPRLISFKASVVETLLLQGAASLYSQCCLQPCSVKDATLT